ncbi:PepSY domain-containing protein [Aureibaculum sp. 2210JD6-5]|uniref:PepSY domain-containing protein n=1 Tax=Aureibaculum sp. 2210JD6-5 TaxID=3103957 RepID=UPI002AAC7B72|nr:PepSY domain-containing protein [Aureibaculum sp. 2210JD6-5]MDY7396361.1 PepSY domain-containing protein [Aureibaculum sp. 2210JD6-5]
MLMNKKRQKQAKILRIFRKIHRTTGALLFIFFFIVSITGFLLGWKKNSNELLLPNTYKGTSNNLADWISIEELHNIANGTLHDSISNNLSLEVDRIDIRKEKGIVKFVYKNHVNEVQLDGATGRVLNIGKRHSDTVENIHDGSILDSYFNTSNGQIKVIYTTVMSLALLTFTITGFWLWYGPKRMRNSR